MIRMALRTVVRPPSIEIPVDQVRDDL